MQGESVAAAVQAHPGDLFDAVKAVVQAGAVDTELLDGGRHAAGLVEVDLGGTQQNSGVVEVQELSHAGRQDGTVQLPQRELDDQPVEAEVVPGRDLGELGHLGDHSYGVL